jgi:hypothetical protein
MWIFIFVKPNAYKQRHCSNMGYFSFLKVPAAVNVSWPIMVGLLRGDVAHPTSQHYFCINPRNFTYVKTITYKEQPR